VKRSSEKRNTEDSREGVGRYKRSVCGRIWKNSVGFDVG
jgi:hypothetical protein